MPEVVLFHHVQGLTQGVVALAEEWRNAGHTVHTPDLMDGRTFDTLEAGLAHVKELGFGTLMERGVQAVEGMPENLVYAGISAGVMAAQRLAQTRPGARGAVFLESCLPFTEFGSAWPDAVPVQIHGMEGDEFFDEDLPSARALVEHAKDAELFVYPGERHLFTDSSLSTYEPETAAAVRQRILEFLGRL